jgi:hypothetical protein
MPWQLRFVLLKKDEHAEIKMNCNCGNKTYYNHCRLGIRSKNETYKSRRFPFLLAIFIFYSQFGWFTAADPRELGLLMTEMVETTSKGGLGTQITACGRCEQYCHA